MKIGILGTRGIPNNYGGFEQFAAWLSQGLVERGHEVYVYNSSRHPFQEKSWNGVHIIHCRDLEHKIGTAGQFFYDLACNKDAATRDFDVLMHLGYSSDAVWWRKWPSRTVNIVNMDGLEWKRTKYNLLTRKFLKRSEYWAARHGDKLVADSPAIKNHIRNEYGKTAVYIPYAARIFGNRNATVLNRYNLAPGKYCLLIARMEKENNIEMIMRGYRASGIEEPMLVVGGVTNKFGKALKRKYGGGGLRFEGAIYDQDLLDNLRAYCRIYFHGHSVGGTNPSLLEAMGCGCYIAAHDNPFNRAVLENNARYFSNETEIASIFSAPVDDALKLALVEANFRKIRAEYAPRKVLDAYERLIAGQTP